MKCIWLFALLVCYSIFGVATATTDEKCPTNLLNFSDTKAMIFTKNSHTPCDPALNQLRGLYRKGYERSLSPIMCVNINYGVPSSSPLWTCSSGYTLPQGYRLWDMRVVCHGMSDSGNRSYVYGTCQLQYGVRHSADDNTWVFTIAKYFMYALLILFLFIVTVLTKGSVSSDVCIVITKGAASGGSFGFAT